jgi:hypothetical protein
MPASPPSAQDLVQLQDWLACKLDTMARDIMFSFEQQMNQQALGGCAASRAVCSQSCDDDLLQVAAAVRCGHALLSLASILPLLGNLLLLHCCRWVQHRHQRN